MATATSPDKENREDNFELELSRERKRIESVFEEIIQCLESEKKDLFNQLDKILIRYQSYKRESDELRKRKIELERLSLQNQGQFSSYVKYLQDDILKQINTELKGIVIPVKPKLVGFVCDKNALLVEVRKLCKLVETLSEIDYKSKTQSISVCHRGSGNEQFNYPLGITVDHNTGNIYVADQFNHCVKVFDNTAKYLFKFGDSRGEGKMHYPRGLAICCNTVLISQSNDHILVYQLDGKFVTRIGNSGSGDLQFNFPFGLTTDESNNDIYICDFNNNRIQIISQNFQYKSQFGKDLLHSPTDIKLYKDNIFIIDESNPCLHIFNKDLDLQKSVITRGRGQQVINPWFFFIDEFGNILISDFDSNSILILNSEFELIHKISTSNQPTGITMNKEDRIIVVCQSANNCLQIF